MSETDRPYRFEQFFATRRLMHFCPTPDGDQVLFSSDISGQFNLWRVCAESGWPEQLTLFQTETVRQAACSPDGRQIAFSADPEGNEQYQLYVMAAVGGWPEQITHQPDVQHEIGPGSFSPDGRLLAYSANAENSRDVSVYIRDLATGQTRTVAGAQGVFWVIGFSPAGESLLVIEFRGNTDQEAWVVDTATGERLHAPLFPGRPARCFPSGWTPDGRGFFFLTDDGRDFLGVARYDLGAGTWSYVVSAAWDVDAASLSGDGRLLGYVTNEAGHSVVRIRDLTSGQDLPLPPLPTGVIQQIEFAPRDSRHRLFLRIASYKQADTVYALDMDRRALTQVTRSMLGNIPDEVFVEPELVTIPSADGLNVPAWLYRPRQAAGGRPVPAVLCIHGGPEQQERPNYAYGGFYQYLLSRGIAILAPNIRGSTGFGTAYQKLIHRDWGGGELLDLEACGHYLKSLPWIDPERIGAWGGSFGGFATLSLATRRPEMWACACDFCGPANLLTFVRSVPAHWKAWMKAWVGDAEEDLDLLVERSPITYVDQLRCPLMVVQGANDPRVVKAESDQMVERIRTQGRMVDYLVIDDEGHGFVKQENRLRGYRAMADFLVRHLLPGR